MYEGIIDALMKLFALMVIHSRANDSIVQAKKSVNDYLKARYNAELSQKYYLVFEEFCNRCYNKSTEEEKMHEVEHLFFEACESINKEYNFDIKVNLLFNLLKFSIHDRSALEKEIEFLDRLANILSVDDSTYVNMKNFIIFGVNAVENKSLLRIVQGADEKQQKDIKYIVNDDQVVVIEILWLPQTNELLVRYSGDRNLYLSGHKMNQNIVYIFPPGAMLKTSRINPVYQSDIMASYIQKDGQARIVYTAENVEYKFNRSQIGLHRFNFRETSGHFVGILGGSGVGKTTLLNVLNGNLKPSSGSIKINGHDLHKEKDLLEGIIGYVPQDDLLIEELTVYENLRYNAKMCFGGMSEEELEERVEHSLYDFDLVEARDLVVGNPMKKVLSGGQRKRLNIALELMREPLVLLADEPTSGLSSMDTEKVVALLKRQTRKGSLVIANIHQPASDIYKQFDRVIVMDKGGRVVYSGNPLDAISYFKKAANYINPEETNCPTCGNVKTEQPLRIIEARMVSASGRFIRQRKVSPDAWFDLYAKNIEPEIINHVKKKNKVEDIPNNAFKIPDWFNQFKNFFGRDLKSKLTNKQYLLIAAIEAPLLALIFAFFAKTEIDGVYQFIDNSNLPSYLFMSIVVALFIGMTISAEEIFKDRLLLKREAFLNLSRSAYLTAKISMIFAISAIQMLVYVLVANSILEIRGMTFYFWITLFSTACFANMLALNLSAGLKSIVAIYILIPLMLIPQLLFSGVIVDFQNMNSSGNPKYTPVVGDAMAARWAYEAIAVEQFKNNKYQKWTFDEKLEAEIYNFALYYRLPETQNIVYTIEQTIKRGETPKAGYFELLRNEIITLSDIYSGLNDYSFINQNMTLADLSKVKNEFDSISYYGKKFYDEKLDILHDAQKSRDEMFGGKEVANSIRPKYVNSKLEETLTGRYQKNNFIYNENKIVHMGNPVYHITESTLGRSHFYAPYKMVLGKRIEVMTYNLFIIWIMIAGLFFTLYADILRRITVFIENLRLARNTRNMLRLEQIVFKPHVKYKDGKNLKHIKK